MGPHLLVSWLADLVVWFDKSSQRSLRSIVPDFEEATANPAAFICQRSIVIGPKRNFGSATAFALLITLFVLCSGSLMWIDSLATKSLPAQRPPLWQGILILGLLLLGIGAVFYGSFRFVSWLLRGATLILGPSQVTIEYRNIRVVCPWALFKAVSFQKGKNRIEFLLPEGATDSLRSETPDGQTLAQGTDVKTKPLRVGNDGATIEMRDMFQVRIMELANLLSACAKSLPVLKTV